jgi:acyl-CoA synthetase (AMP-forming)/AMP-acid ligase II
MTAADLLARDFATIPDLLRAHAAERGSKTALADDAGTMSYAELDRSMDRIAAGLQRDGVRPGQAVAILAYPSNAYAALFLGIVRAGAVAAPISPSATPDHLCRPGQRRRARRSGPARPHYRDRERA